jgi:hypothetical protein
VRKGSGANGWSFVFLTGVGPGIAGFGRLLGWRKNCGAGPKRPVIGIRCFPGGHGCFLRRKQLQVVSHFIWFSSSLLGRNEAKLPHRICLEMPLRRQQLQVRARPFWIVTELPSSSGFFPDLADGEEHPWTGFQELNNLLFFKVHPGGWGIREREQPKGWTPNWVDGLAVRHGFEP